MDNYKIYEALRNDLDKVLSFMEHNDPNGEYSMADMLQHPKEHIEILEQWKKDMGTESTERERIHIDDMISTLYMVLLAHKL